MAEWNFDAFGDDEDQMEGDQGQRVSRECKIFVVDGSESMVSSDSDTGPYFATAMKGVGETMCKQCVSVANDFIGVIVINTKNTENNHGFGHMVCLQDVDIPGAERVKQIEEFCNTENLESTFEKKFGGHGDCSWDEVFWLAGTMFSNNATKFGDKRIFILTDCDRPFEAGDTDRSKRIMQKWRDLKDQDVTINLIPLAKNFDGSRFWNLIEGKEYSTESVAKTLESLLEDVRRKEYKKRAMGNIPFSLGEGIEFSVGL